MKKLSTTGKNSIPLQSFLIILISGLLFSCNQNNGDDDTMSELVTYSGENTSSENELFFDGNKIIIEEISSADDEHFRIQVIEKDDEDLRFRAKLIPTELYLRNQGLQGDELKQALIETDGEQMIYFEIEDHQKQDVTKKYFTENMDKSISYLSFDIYRDFLLISTDGDSVEANYSHYERNYHVAPFERVVVNFSPIDKTKNWKLIYHDQLFGKGTAEFSFTAETTLNNNSQQPS